MTKVQCSQAYRTRDGRPVISLAQRAQNRYLADVQSLEPAPWCSIVAPVYNEEANLTSFVSELREVMDAQECDWELILVDDGSRDHSAVVAAVLAAQFPNVKAIRLARNFGKEIALTCGLRASRGKAVIMMDADAQHPPTIIPEMLRRWHAGAAMVTALRQTRRDQSALRSWLSRQFYRVLSRMSSVEIPANAGDFRLLDRKIVDVLNQFPERTRFMKGLYQWPGFSNDFVDFEVRERTGGGSSFNLARLWRLALDGIFAFSTAPLKIWTYVGLTVGAGAVIYAGLTLVQKLVWGIAAPGYASLLITTLLLGAVILIAQGIQGEYIARIYDEVKGRPLYVVAALHGFEASHPFVAIHGPSEPSTVRRADTLTH